MVRINGLVVSYNLLINGGFIGVITLLSNLFNSFQRNIRAPFHTPKSRCRRCLSWVSGFGSLKRRRSFHHYPWDQETPPKKTRQHWKLAGGFKDFWNFHPENWGNDPSWSNLTKICVQMGWNHQLGRIPCWKDDFEVYNMQLFAGCVFLPPKKSVPNSSHPPRNKAPENGWILVAMDTVS